MSDYENGSCVPSTRQALVRLFHELAEKVQVSDVPIAFKHAVAGSIRHRANKLERCDTRELSEISAALFAFAEVMVVCDATVARAIQSVACCVDVAIDEQLAQPAPTDPSEPLPNRIWNRCTSCRRYFLTKEPASVLTCWTCVRRASGTKTEFAQAKLDLYPSKRIRARYAR